MAQRTAANRGRRNGTRTANPGRTDDGTDDDDDEGDGEEDRDPESLLRMANAILARHSNVQQQAAEVAKVYQDLFKERRQKNRWKKQAETLAEELPEGAVVLVDKDAEAYAKLSQRPNFDFTKVPDLLETLENNNATLSTENTNFKQASLFDTTERSNGWNKAAVQGVVASEKLHAELQKRTVDVHDAAGKKTGTKEVKTLMVRKMADPKAALVPFNDYVDKNVSYMWPAIKAKSADTTTAPAPSGGPPRVSIPTVESVGTNNTATTDNPVERWAKARREAQAAQADPLRFGADSTRGRTGSVQNAPK